MRFLLLLTLLYPLVSTFAAGPDWRAILGPSEGVIPPPVQDEVVWRDDFNAALAEAKQTNRPLFVTLRCPPCKQCSFFDALVLRGSRALTPLYRQFITVRITDAMQMDHRILRFTEFQDLDVSWWGYFLSPEGRIYGVYGGKDHESDQNRINEPGLVKTMQRILAHHHDPRRPGWEIDGPLPQLSGPPKLADSLPGAEAYFRDRPDLKKQGCIHCHQVNDILYTAKMAVPGFDKQRDVVPWPFPENLGLRVDPEDGLKIVAVEAGSAAAVAGLQVGDQIVVGEGRKLYSEADLRAVLHRAPDGPAVITLFYLRNGQPAQAVVRTGENWKKTILHWRKSIYDGVLGTGPGFFPLQGPGMGKGSLSLKPFVGGKDQHPAVKAGLRANQEVVAVDGMRRDMDVREFMTWFRMNYEHGDKVVLQVREGGKERDIQYQLP